MFERILIPLDGSEMAEMALPYGEELASKLGSEIILYHVYGHELQHQKQSPQIYLDTVAETVKQNLINEVKVTTKTQTGEPAGNICNLVDKNKIDLIIMTSIGTSGLKIGKMLGSVTDHVCRTVPSPVLIVRPNKSNRIEGSNALITKILIPFDGSELSKRAMSVGEELAAKLNIPIILFEMAQMSYPSGISSYMYGNEYVKIDELDEQAIEYNYAKANESEQSRVLSELISIEKELRTKGLSVDHRITSGIDAAKEINEISKENGIDLVLMSTHGRSGLGHWVLGSVAEKVLRYSEVPLLLVNARAG